jgi:hypothetical protein
LPLWAANAEVAMLAAAIAAPKISLVTFRLLLREWANKTTLSYRRAEDWNTSSQIPSHLLERNAKLHCTRSAADCGEYRHTW